LCGIWRSSPVEVDDVQLALFVMSKGKRLSVHVHENDSKLQKLEEPSSEDDIFSQNLKYNYQLLERRNLTVLQRKGIDALPIHERIISHGFSEGKYDHVIGMLIIRDANTHLLTGVIVIGAALIPNLNICKSHQVNDDGSPLFKMSFASKALVDYYNAQSFIPHQYCETSFFRSGYAIGACETLMIDNCVKYYEELRVPEDKIEELFPAGGAAILPQPKNREEEQSRRVALEATINYIRGFDRTEYHSMFRNGRKVTNVIRVEVEELEASKEIFERLLCYRVLESNTNQELCN
jgi:hypothetical protein